MQARRAKSAWGNRLRVVNRQFQERALYPVWAYEMRPVHTQLKELFHRFAVLD